MSGTSRLVLVRHVASVWSESGILQGTKDPPLSPDGVHQLPRLLVLVQRCCNGAAALVMSSDLQRAYATAQFLEAGLRGAEVRVFAELREMSFGEFEGEAESALADSPELRRAFSDVDARMRWPGATDTLRDLALGAFNVLMGELVEHRPEVMIVVSHGLLLQGVISQILFGDPDLAHRVDVSAGSVSLFEYDHKRREFAVRWLGVPSDV